MNGKELAELLEKVAEKAAKETAREILILLGNGFDENAMKNFKELPWYEQFCREMKLRYGVDLEEQ